jgi:ABC-type glycerol-3-phosphate transport system substrate-binding protein
MLYLFCYAAAYALILSSSNFVTAYGKEALSTQRSLCELEECTTICPSNLTDFQDSMNSPACSGRPVTTLKLLTSDFGEWAALDVAERYSMEHPELEIEIVKLEGNGNLFENIINEAKSKTGLFDIFITPPHVMGDIVEEDGWADLTDFVNSGGFQGGDWSDIFLGYRKWISQYQDKILMFPLDGDVLSMFYREDVLKEFGLQVPRTWDEYNAVANATHGKTFKNQTLTGSCVGRMKGCAGAYWANLVLSSMTQLNGMSSGSLFDTSDMKPLLGEALVQTLEWMETQAKFGPEDEFDGCVGIQNDLYEGSCVLTYNWGNSFNSHLSEGSVFGEGEAKLGVAMTPGSTHVLNRTSMKLVPCDEELCSVGGIYYDDIGWVNRAPYLAFGGWACSVNNYTSPEKKALATEFCGYAASRDESNKMFSRNSSNTLPGADPFRKSQLDLNSWVENGFEQGSVLEYFETINAALSSENAVMDIRFPLSFDIYSLLDSEIYTYLVGATTNVIPESERPSTRQTISDRLEKEFDTMVNNYNSRPTTRSTLLQQYQKLRNVYFVEVDMNYLKDGIRYYGYFIATLQLTLAVGFAIWTYVKRTTPVVKASQPFFLILLCVGAFTFSMSIFPMIIDDESSSQEACNRACMSLPWFLCLGWSVLFSALYAKLRRINLVVSNAKRFRFVRISEKDMMASISILFTLNLVLIILWNTLDPIIWARSQISPTKSIGYCTVADRDNITWKIIVVLLGILNGGVLIVANVEAYKARKIDTEYGESVYIGLIMLFFLQIVLVGVPLYFIVSGNVVANFFLSSSMVSIMSMSVLLLMFIPKFVIYRKRLREGNNGKRNRKSSVLKGRGTSVPESSVFDNAEKSMQVRVVYEKTWKARIAILECALQEAGIDAKFHLKNANIIDDRSEIIPIGEGEGESENSESRSSSFFSRVRQSVISKHRDCPVSAQSNQSDLEKDFSDFSSSIQFSIPEDVVATLPISGVTETERSGSSHLLTMK